VKNSFRANAGTLLCCCFEEWVVAERASREQDCLRALETLADAAEQRLDYAEALSLLRRTEGQPERAARPLRASLAWREFLRPLSEVERVQYGVLRNAVREALGESALGAAEAEGDAMTLEQAIAYALTSA
jgi:hypothetical protein